MLRSGDKCREVIDLAFATAMDFPSHLQTVAFLLNQSEQDREQHVPETGTLQFKLKPRLRLIKLAAPEKRDVNKSVPTATPEITTFISKDPLDLLIQLDSVDLVDIRPQPTGFFVSLAVDSLGAQALVNFVEASKELIVNALGETDNRRAFVEPFSDPMQHELDVGVDVRVEVKVSEHVRRLTSSTFSSPANARLYGPGDAVLDVFEGLALGVCTVTLHLMGAWYDRTKCGPLIYLESVCFLNDPPRPRFEEKASSITYWRRSTSRSTLRPRGGSSRDLASSPLSARHSLASCQGSESDFSIAPTVAGTETSDRQGNMGARSRSRLSEMSEMSETWIQQNSKGAQGRENRETTPEKNDACEVKRVLIDPLEELAMRSKPARHNDRRQPSNRELLFT